MKAKEVVIGATYVAKVSGQLAHVQIVSALPSGGWLGRNRSTGREVRIRSAQRLRSLVR